MARIKKGILGPILGKLANFVGYERFGVAVLRMAPRKSKKKGERTDAQQAVNLKFKLVKSFVSDVNEFIKAGFKVAALGTTKIAENVAVSDLLRQAITGDFPHFKLDYSKVTVSKGKLDTPKSPTVTISGDFLNFKWDIDPKWGYLRKRDQVMMLAYLPANGKCHFSLSGARVTAGEDVLEIRYVMEDTGSLKKDTAVETYIAFIADDRQSISDSVYVGRIDL